MSFSIGVLINHEPYTEISCVVRRSSIDSTRFFAILNIGANVNIHISTRQLAMVRDAVIVCLDSPAGRALAE